MGLRTDLTRLFAGEAGVRALKSRRARKILDLPDRRLLAEAYIPAFAAEGGVILWVGCRVYTADDYSALEAHGAEVWTTTLIRRPRAGAAKAATGPGTSARPTACSAT